MEGAWRRTAHKVAGQIFLSNMSRFFLCKIWICFPLGSRATGRVATTPPSTSRHFTPMLWRGTMGWKGNTDKRWVFHIISSDRSSFRYFFSFHWALLSFFSGCLQTSWMPHLSQEVEEMVLSPVPQENLLKWKCNLPMWDLWKGRLHQCGDSSEPREDQAQRRQTFHMWVLPQQVCYCNVFEWTQKQETWGELKGRGCSKENVPLWPLWKAADKQDETASSHRSHPWRQAWLQVSVLRQDLHFQVQPPDPRRLFAHRSVALPMWLLPENVCTAQPADRSQGEPTPWSCRTFLCRWGCRLCPGSVLNKIQFHFNLAHNIIAVLWI